MEQLFDVAITINNHRLEVFLISLVAFALFAFTMWAAHQRAKNERWMWYFAWAFAISSLQYGLLTISWIGSEYIQTYVVLSPILQICSATNNLLLLGAARDLQNKKGVWPKWAWWLAIGTVVATFIAPTAPLDNWPLLLLQRSPDTIFSGLTFTYVSFAIIANISNRRSPTEFLIALAFATTYALVYVVWGLNPLLTPYLHPSSRYGESLMMTDSILWAIAFPLKLFLCATTFLLTLRYFETFNELTKLQDIGVNVRQNYLSSEGVVRIISEKFKGDVSLFVMLPGQKVRRVACIKWSDDDPQEIAKVMSWAEINSLARRVLKYAEEVIWHRVDSVSGDADSQKLLAMMSAIFTVPVKTHGATIGCLQVARRDFPFSQIAIKQIRELANLVSPAVQSYRELAALDQLSIEFAREQSEETCEPSIAVEKIASIIHDVFSPSVTRLHMTFGFTEISPVYLGREYVQQGMKKKIEWTDWSSVPTYFTTYEFNATFKLLKKTLTARSVDTSVSIGETNKLDEKLIIGNLTLAIHEDRDDPTHPALGANYLHRKAASTLAADAFFDFVRDYFNYHLKTFGVELNERLVNVEHWFRSVQKMAQAVGLAWVVVKHNGQPDLLGDEGARSVVHLLEIKKGGTPDDVEIECNSPPEPTASVHHVLRLRLPNANGFMWLGVVRAEFGPELSFYSPWKAFLINFAQVADAALGRIIAAEEFQRIQIEAAQYQGLATAAVTMGTIAHQLSNLIHGQSASLSTLLDALKLNQMTAGEDLKQLIHSMKGSAEQMRRLLLSLTHVTKTDDHRPCQLRKAVEQAGHLFAVSLLQRGIGLNIAVSDDLYLDVPFNVATLAIANLVGNAKDAMANGGAIQIEAEANGDMVLCRVSDEGKGVAPRLRERIFELGVTGKEGGSGWGLYLTKRSLLENRSHVELTKSDEHGSVFTIRFPKLKQQEAR